MIVSDPRNPRAQEIHAELESRLQGSDLSGLVVVIGGDGFMLRAVAEHGLDASYLGLNAGHLGFLLNDVEDGDWDALADRISEQQWREHRFPLLEAEVETLDGRTIVEFAVNDAYLERTTGQTGRLRVTVDGNRVVDLLVADGLIFATALGSTAYNFSAGGSPSHPTLHSLHVTAICPHLPRLTPFILPETARTRVDVLNADRRPVRAVTDGRDIGEITSLTVGYSTRRVRFLYFASHDFTRQMLRKIIHA